MYTLSAFAFSPATHLSYPPAKRAFLGSAVLLAIHLLPRKKPPALQKAGKNIKRYKTKFPFSSYSLLKTISYFLSKNSLINKLDYSLILCYAHCQ